MIFENGKTGMNGFDLLKTVEQTCSEHGLLYPGAGVVIACSGGVDSVVLAHLLKRLSAVWNLRLCIAHFEHGIRGAESKGDAEFVGRLAHEWGISFRMGSGNVPEYAEKNRMSIETAARELRYSFLRDLRRELGYDVIALAHHGDDQAETVLMRVIRGTGVSGLSAMRFRQAELIRPLLSLRKKALQAYCVENNLSYREDGTNFIPDATRNILRLELLPKLRMKYNPAIDEALCQLSFIAAEVDDYLEAETLRVWPHVLMREDGKELSRDAFIRLHPALQREILRKYIQHVFGSMKDVGFQHLESLRQLLLKGQTGAHLELPDGRILEISYGRLRPASNVKPAFSSYQVNIPGKTELSEYGMRLLAEIRSVVPEKTLPSEFYCDLDSLPEMPVVRTRLPGDRIITSGGTRKLKDYFIDIKMDREERDRQPILACGQKVLWVIGRRRSCLFQPDAGTRKVLFLKVYQ